MTVTQLKTRRSNKLSHVKRDRGYRFTDRDPELEELCKMITNSGLSTRDIAEKIHKSSANTTHISPTTIDNWMNGKTRKPQNYNMSWVGFALGYTRGWINL